MKRGMLHTPEPQGRRGATSAATAGLLLAGGASTRFGSEKAAAPFRGGLMMDAVARVFSPLPAFAVSARPGSRAEQRAQALGAPVLQDEPGFPAGPLTGLAAGLAWAKREGFAFVATAPCDMPLLPANLVLRLVETIKDSPAAFAVTDQGDHPLCALWRVELIDPLCRRLAQSAHPAVKAFLREQRAEAVWFDDTAAFANANRNDVLAQLEHSA